MRPAVHPEQHTNDEEIAAIARQLENPNASNRREVEQIVSGMDSEQTEALLDYLLDTWDRNQRRWVRYQGYVAGAFTCLTVLVVWKFWHYMKTDEVRFYMAWLTVICSCLFPALLGKYHIMRQMQATVRALTSIEDLRVVGPLLDLLNESVCQLNRQVVAALTRLLPRLQASDAGLLTARQRRRLSEALLYSVRGVHNFSNDHIFAIAILKALEQIGDRRELPLVARIANCKTRSAYMDSIQAAARACLPHLRQRDTQAQATNTLLRAADAAPNGLLRAVGTPDDLSDQLLRPGSEDRPLAEREDHSQPSVPRTGILGQ